MAPCSNPWLQWEVITPNPWVVYISIFYLELIVQQVQPRFQGFSFSKRKKRWERGCKW